MADLNKIIDINIKTNAKDTQEKFDSLRKSIKSAEEQVDEMAKKFGENSEQADAARKSLSSLTMEYDNLSKSATDVNATFEDINGSIQPLTARLGEAEDRLYELALAGKQGTKEYQDLLQATANYRRVQIQTDATVDAASKTMTQKLGSAAKGVASGFAVAQGAMGLFGDESGKINEALLKVNSAMALLDGIDGLKEAGKTFTGLGGKIKDVGKNAFGSLRQGIISTGIGALVVGIGLLIANFDAVKEAVLKFIPGLKAVGDFIGGLVTGITDFLGITSEAEREAEKLGKQSKKNQEIAKNEIDLLKAKGASAREIYNAEKKAAQDRIKDLNRLGQLNKKLTEEELKEKKDLIQQIRILDAQEVKRKADEAAKAKEKADQEAEKAKEKAKAAYQKTLEDRKAAGAAFNEVVKKLNEDLERLNKSSFEVQRLDAQKAYNEDLKKLKEALDKKAVTQKQYQEALDKLDANRAEKVKTISENEQKAAIKIFENTQKTLRDMQAGFDTTTLEERQKFAEEKLNEQKTAQLTELATAEAQEIEASNALLKTDEEREAARLEIQKRYGELRTGLNTAYNKAISDSNAALAKADTARIKSEEQEKIKITLEANDKSASLDKKYYEDLAAIYDDDTLSFKEKEEEKAELQKKYQADQLAETKRRIEEEIALQEKATVQDKDRLEKLKVDLAKVNSDIAENNNNARKERREKFLEEAEEIVGQIQGAIDTLSNLGQALIDQAQQQMDAIDARTEKEMASLEETKNAELASKELTAEERTAIEERYQREQIALQQKADEEKKKLQKKQADIQFAITIANIIASTAAAIIRAFADLGPIGGAIMAGVIGVTSGLQISAANKQRNEVKALAKGGFVSGPGGPTDDMIPAYLSNGEAVINAAAVKRFAPLLSMINQSTGGNPIEAPKFAMGGTATDAILLGISDRFNSIAATQQQDAPLKAYVLDTEVSSTSVKNNRIRRASTY